MIDEQFYNGCGLLSYLCIPEQSIHNTIPRLRLAHLGLGDEQSAHLSLPETSRKSIPYDKLNNKDECICIYQ